MREIRRGTHKLYKGHCFIIFYDKTDEVPLYIFDNVREILKFQKKEFNKNNVNQVNVEIYRAIKNGKHLTRFLTGRWLRVYIIDIKGEI